MAQAREARNMPDASICRIVEIGVQPALVQPLVAARAPVVIVTVAVHGHHLMGHADVVTAARNLMERTDPATAGLWPRATALLARQALEAALDDFWRVRAPGMEHCSARAQLLCLSYYLGDEELAERVSYAWGPD